jgi:cytochrome b561
MSIAKYEIADTTPMDARRPPFDSVTRGFHWATVVIVLAMFASAWLHAQSHDHALKALLLQIHRSLGVTIWAVTVLRLVWRLTNAKLPPFPTRLTKLHRATVQVSEYALYALLLVQPATGLAATLFRGHQFAIFLWQIPKLLPKDIALWTAFQLAHELGAWALGALVAGHAAAALIHHFVLRDDVLECMAPLITTKRHKPALWLGRLTDSRHWFALARQTITTLVVSLGLSAWFDVKEGESSSCVRRRTRIRPGRVSVNQNTR